jgi:hypothetical protein
MLKDNLKPAGIVNLVLTDEFGNIKQQEETNLVVNTGLAYITSRMLNADTAVVSHMQVGTDVTPTPVAATDTVLVNPLTPRVGLSSAAVRVQTTVLNDSVQYVASFPAGSSTGAIGEAGLFNDLTAGSMIARTKFPVINKGALDTLAITWKITVAP